MFKNVYDNWIFLSLFEVIFFKKLYSVNNKGKRIVKFKILFEIMKFLMVCWFFNI